MSDTTLSLNDDEVGILIMCFDTTLEHIPTLPIPDDPSAAAEQKQNMAQAIAAIEALRTKVLNAPRT